MMEDCATVMSAPQGCTDDKAVVGIFMEALKDKVGADRYRMWFSDVVEYTLVDQKSSNADPDGDHASADSQRSELGQSPGQLGQYDCGTILISVRGKFALERLQNNYLPAIRGAACQAMGRRVDVVFQLVETKAHQVELPFATSEENETGNRESEPVHRVDPSHSSNHYGGKRNDNTRGNSRTRRVSRQPDSHRKQRRSRSLGNLLASSPIGDGNEKNRLKDHPRQVAQNASFKRNGASTKAKKRRSQENDLVQLDFTSLETGHTAGSVSQASSTSGRPSTGVAGTNSIGVKSGLESNMNSSNFIPGQCNRLAHTAMIMACQDPATASPLFLCGPTGTGKTHLLHAIADQLRRRFRLRRVMNLSAEQFTNDFISSVGNSGITAFRRRYREVDALLIDDVQFLGSKKATLREMLYTVETLGGQGKPLIFAGSESPTEIDGLSNELAGRMASGLVCHLQPLDSATREKLLRQWIGQRCNLEVSDSLIDAITPLLAGDGRVISGIVNVLNTLQRMLGRSPSIQELRQFSGQMLRSSQAVTTLGLIESAVCQAFHLPEDSLRSKSQTRAVSGPRKLAMYLSRQLTPSAYSEIGNHFGGRSHSTAISAEQHVKSWITEEAAIGRGVTAMSAREAIDRIETLLRTG